MQFSLRVTGMHGTGKGYIRKYSQVEMRLHVSVHNRVFESVSGGVRQATESSVDKQDPLTLLTGV